MALEALKEAPLWQKAILAAFVVITLGYVYYAFVADPMRTEIKRLSAERTRLNNEVAVSETKVRNLDKIKKEYERLLAEFKTAEEKLPKEREVTGLLKQVSDLGIQAGLSFKLWKPEARKPDPGGLFEEIPIKVEVAGGYHNVGLFFHHIAKLQRLVNISDIKITDPKLVRNALEMKVTMTATTFAALEKEKAEEIAKEKAKKAKPPARPPAPGKET
ncbi:MAG: type 4a pilus biogenesis protein PilO [Nitrospirae bacterium]|nr:type 4a pilus biogenesis protein PilO [Nitrospirota bacterium]